MSQSFFLYALSMLIDNGFGVYLPPDIRSDSLVLEDNTGSQPTLTKVLIRLASPTTSSPILTLAGSTAGEEGSPAYYSAYSHVLVLCSNHQSWLIPCLEFPFCISSFRLGEKFEKYRLRPCTKGVAGRTDKALKQIVAKKLGQMTFDPQQDTMAQVEDGIYPPVAHSDIEKESD